MEGSLALQRSSARGHGTEPAPKPPPAKASARVDQREIEKARPGGRRVDNAGYSAPRSLVAKTMRAREAQQSPAGGPAAWLRLASRRALRSSQQSCRHSSRASFWQPSQLLLVSAAPVRSCVANVPGLSHSGDRGSRWLGGFSVHIARDETCGLGIRQLIGHESESLVDGASWTRGSFNRVSSLGT